MLCLMWAFGIARREDKAEMEGILEETTRENIDMSNYKLEAEALRDAVTDLQGQLEEAKETREELEKLASEAKADMELLTARGDKKLNALRQNLLRSEGECQQLDALMAHVRAVIHMFLDSSGKDLTMLKRLHQRLNPDDQEDDA
jgi:predicted RNase H-like nuclease (RuvC/YqgF family)